jgi:hypothetical protein
LRHLPPSSSSLPKAVAPPPPLPPPTLQELGLSFSVLTPDLSPSHFSTPPWSGTFLKPHYLLLCHAQGLDVLPLVSPPASEPYALIRRACFKSIVVMEQRGVLVAIAGRRDGVRVYALEEVMKAIEWRIEFEGRKERERLRREAAKKGNAPVPDISGHSSSSSLKRLTKASSFSPSIPSTPNPKMPTSKRARPAITTSGTLGRPPPYSNPSHIHSQPNGEPVRSESTRTIGTIFAGASALRRCNVSQSHDPDSKAEWEEGWSDDEAINIVAAGASGSQALDERTSAIPPSIQPTRLSVAEPRPVVRNRRSSTLRRSRPGNQDLSISAGNPVAAEPPSPTPTLLTLRQALSQPPGRTSGQELDVDSPMGGDEVADEGGGITLAQALLESRLPNLPPAGTRRPQQPIFIVPGAATGAIAPSTPRTSDDEEEEEEGGISLAQVLMESRLPHLPPAGTRQPQEPIYIDSSVDPAVQVARRPSDANSGRSGSGMTDRSNRRRRRWSVLDGVFTHGSSSRQSLSNPPSPLPRSVTDTSNIAHTSERAEVLLSRVPANGIEGTMFSSNAAQAFSRGDGGTATTNRVPPARPELILPLSRSRLVPWIINKAFRPRTNGHYPPLTTKSAEDHRTKSGTTPGHLAPAPKLEYVKLPGTKGALLVKAVETPKKRQVSS